MSVLKAKGLYPFPMIYAPVHPTQLYECFLMLGVFVFLKRIDGAEFARQRQFFIFWFLYGANRLVIELLRGDRNIAFGNLTYAQLISICLVVFGATGYLYTTQKWKRTGVPEPILK